MKAGELRNKSTEELRTELQSLLRAQFSLRMNTPASIAAKRGKAVEEITG